MPSAPIGYVSPKVYSGACWWCGAVAGSREHRYKRTDIVRLFGGGSYKGPAAPVRGIGGETRSVRGPNSAQLKFSPSLCHDCNTTRSQMADEAYETFIDYLHDYGQLILAREVVDFGAIYGTRWRQHSEDLTRYIVKHACCRVVEAGFEVRPELVDFLNGSRKLRTFAIAFEIREDILSLKDQEGVGGLWIGDLYCMKHEASGAVRNINSFLGHEWLRIVWTHDHGIRQLRRKRLVPLARGWNVDPATLRATV